MTYRSPQRRERTWDHALEDETRPVLEVAVYWRDTQVHVEHGGRGFRIGDSFPEPHGPLVTHGADGFVLHVPPGARGMVDVEGVARPIEESDADVRLTLGDEARVELSGLTYSVAIVARGRPRLFGRWSFARAWTVLVSLLLHAVALFALSRATFDRSPEEEEEQGISKETQRYFLDVMANVYRDTPYWDPEYPAYMRCYTPDTCKMPTWIGHTSDKTVEKKVATAWGGQHGAMRALQMAFVQHHPLLAFEPIIFDDAGWQEPLQEYGDRGYRRLVLLEHGDWDETIALGPPRPPRAYVATVRTRRWRRAARLQVEFLGTPMVRKVLLARGPALRDCFDALRDEPLEATFVARPDGSVTDIIAEPCVHERLAETQFLPAEEASQAKIRMLREER